MTMIKTVLTGILAVVLLVPSVYAGLTELPDGYLDGWGGKSSYNLDLGGGQVLDGWIEFAVYDTFSTGFESPGDKRYMYVYQIFNTGANATAAITYFSLTGIVPEAIESIDDDIEVRSSGGADPTDYYFNLSKTEAIFIFDNGMLVVGEKSAYLLLGSDYAPIVGGYELAPSSDNDVPVPGDENNGGDPIPEPATLALLLGGLLVSLRKHR